MKFLYSLFIVTILVNCSYAQNQGNQWYFGYYAGLDFNSGAPVPVLSSSIAAFEGSASVADKTTGNVLFYTDGSYAWDATNSVMPSVSYMGGNSSTTQAAAIVPKPGSSTLYYVFAVDAQAGIYATGNGGLSCNIIDMSLNGGLGDVTTQDSSMLTPTDEKIAVTGACDGIDYWVVVHLWDSDAFYAYLVTSAGIQAPVISNSGIIHQDVGSGNNAESIGYMRISSDSKRLALVCYENLNTVQIFDFDNSTGIVSNPITDTNYPNISSFDGPYGICFSPDNTKLYVSYYTFQALSYPSQIYQYDLSAGNATAIVNSRTSVGTEDTYLVGAIQQGPDGKLYVSRGTDSLGVINNPNIAGTACNYVRDGLWLGGSTSSYGLPELVPGLTGLSTIGSVQPSSSTLCSGQGETLNASGGTTYSWSPITGLSSTSDSVVTANPTITVTYTVTVSTAGGCSDILYDTVNVVPAPNVPTITQRGDTLFSSAQTNNQWYLNDTLIPGATSQYLVIGNTTGSYVVTVVNPANGCSSNSPDLVTSGINQLSVINDQLSVYPNPTSNQLTIISNQLPIDKTEVTNVLGQSIISINALKPPSGDLGVMKQVIDLSNLPGGIYFITVTNKAGQGVVKVVKE